MFKNVLLFIFLFIIIPVNAQIYAEEDSVAPADVPPNVTEFPSDISSDSFVYIRDVAITPEQIDSIKKNIDYAWAENIDSLLKKEQKDKKPERNSSDSTGSFLKALFGSSFLKYFFWTIAALFVGFIIYRLFLSQGIFGRSSADTINDTADEPEINVTDKDYERLQRNAYAAGDYRSAIRFLFLKTLQRLHNKELIVFSADKTNSVYAAELPHGKRNEFASLALCYEFIWYGKAKINKESFDRFEIKFNEFINKI